MDSKIEHIPAVSVLLSVHNGARYLRPAIDSILGQTWTDFEFLIIDDASTDATPELLDTYTDERIRILRNAENRGLTASLNRGLLAARAPLLARMDADDVAYPQRLERQLAYFERHPETILLGAACRNVDGDGRRIRINRLPETDAELRIWQLFRNSFVHPLVMMKTDLARREGFNEQLYAAQDYDLWVRLSAHGPIANLPEPLLDYRVHGGSISATKLQQQLETVTRVHERQLRAWGVQPTPEQLHIHRVIGQTMAPTRIDEAAALAAADWLKRLIAHNDKMQTYDPALFRSVMQTLWLGVFQRKHNHLRPDFLIKHWKHPLHPSLTGKWQIALHTVKNLPMLARWCGR